MWQAKQTKARIGKLQAVGHIHASAHAGLTFGKWLAVWGGLEAVTTMKKKKEAEIVMTPGQQSSWAAAQEQS